MQLLGENPRCQQPTKSSLGGGNLWHIPAVRAVGAPTATPMGIRVQVRGISVPGISRAPANLSTPYLLAKTPPILAWLDTKDNFLCPSRFSFLGFAAHPTVSCSTNIQTCQSACQGEKEVFNKNFNCSITQILLSHWVQGLCFSGRVLCPLGKSDCF